MNLSFEDIARDLCLDPGVGVTPPWIRSGIQFDSRIVCAFPSIPNETHEVISEQASAIRFSAALAGTSLENLGATVEFAGLSAERTIVTSVKIPKHSAGYAQRTSLAQREAAKVSVLISLLGGKKQILIGDRP